MGLSDLVRTGMATMDLMTAGLQATVTHLAFVSRDGYSKPTYAAGVPVQALVKIAPRFIPGGSAIVADATILIPRPYEVGQEDAFELPSGEVMRVLNATSTLNAVGSAYAVTVFVGR
jgi:hypothetical protein